MEKYLRWYVTLEPFYRILLAMAAFVGTLATLTGVVTQNAAFLFIGLFWLGGGSAIVWLTSHADSE